MTEILQKRSEKLYLLRDGAHDIFVNNCQLLKQHQIDGLRFLYSNFRKKKGGIIINSPPNSGKCITVVLFLYAVRDLLKKPILILCRNDEMVIWKEYILKWTGYNEDDIVMDTQKLVKGKKIFITKACGPTFYQHNWGVVVVKEDVITKELYLVSNADYKIWITSTDMKKDLTMLAVIHSWMYPKHKMNVQDFIPNGNKSEMYCKAIYLDNFLEDFVIRENNVETFNSPKETTCDGLTDQDIQIDKAQTPKKSRKNKDATGTKIKRSKKDANDITFTKNIVNTRDNDCENKCFNETIVETANSNNLEKNTEFENNIIPNEDVKGVSIKNVDNDTIVKDVTEFIKNVDNDKLEKAIINEHVNQTMLSGTMEVDGTESINFGNAIDDIVMHENQNEHSTEHEDDDDNKSINTISDKKNESVDIENFNESHNISQEEKIEEQSLENLDNDHNNKPDKSFASPKDKLLNLEETVLKKFKGSFLDSIF